MVTVVDVPSPGLVIVPVIKAVPNTEIERGLLKSPELLDISTYIPA
jgi:hypothetical protein